jgi:hypothetical protein
MLKLTRNEREQEAERKGRKKRTFEEGSGDQCGVPKKPNKCDTAMDENWAKLNCRTSMVQTVLYSRCTETTIAAACNVYMHMIRYK